jgi:Uma2 family endonuclease
LIHGFQETILKLFVMEEKSSCGAAEFSHVLPCIQVKSNQDVTGGTFMEKPIPKVSFQDFIAWETAQSARHELVRGQIVPFAAASKDHNHSADNVHFALREFLEPPCTSYGNDVILQTITKSGENGLRPDVVVSCSPEDANGPGRFILVPRIVVEVRSPSNDDQEWKDKLEEYRNTPSIEQIVIIESETRAIASLNRDARGLWQPIISVIGNGSLWFPTVGFVMTLDAIYRRSSLA